MNIILNRDTENPLFFSLLVVLLEKNISQQYTEKRHFFCVDIDSAVKLKDGDMHECYSYLSSLLYVDERFPYPHMASRDIFKESFLRDFLIFAEFQLLPEINNPKSQQFEVLKDLCSIVPKSRWYLDDPKNDVFSIADAVLVSLILKATKTGGITSLSNEISSYLKKVGQRKSVIAARNFLFNERNKKRNV